MIISILVLIPFSFFCLDASIAHQQQTSLIPSMLIFYHKQQMSITLQGAQAIMILQRATMFSHSSSSLPHIPTNGPTSLANLW